MSKVFFNPVANDPPARFVAGADAITAVEAKAKTLPARVEASRELGMDLDFDDAD
ncbi:hypothetical protein [Streptomyces olivochromogenes]|uniref:hypothetical protein n=1 Tax=Streptomyces olivochromogenes TaxID=1963 RepID=UPI0036CBD012